MAGFVSIISIVPCRDEQTFRDIIPRYLQTLVSLGIAEPELLEWNKSLQWPSPSEGIDTKWPHMRLQEKKELFEVSLLFMLWGDDEQHEKISLELLFDIEETIGPGAPFNDLVCYKQAFAPLAWRIMQAISAQVLGYGCYLADEATDVEAFKATDGKNCDFWWIDLAIVPQEIYERYLPTAEYTAVKRQDEIGIFANREHWHGLPWEE